MITKKLSREALAEMKRVYETYRLALRPNRKSGKQVDAYFQSRYLYQPLDGCAFRAAVVANILGNAPSRAKLQGVRPDIRCYRTGGILVGIDLVSGEFCVEAEKAEAASPIYDDLFVFRGLDAEDLKNFVLVAEYVRLTQSGKANPQMF